MYGSIITANRQSGQGFSIGKLFETGVGKCYGSLSAFVGGLQIIFYKVITEKLLFYLLALPYRY